MLPDPTAESRFPHLELPKFGPISASVTYVRSKNHGDIKNLGGGTVIDIATASGGGDDSSISA